MRKVRVKRETRVVKISCKTGRLKATELPVGATTEDASLVPGLSDRVVNER